MTAGGDPRSAPPASTVVGEVRELVVSFPNRTGTPVDVLRGVDLTLRRGETVGLVGESGSGKTTLALALMGLVPPPGWVREGSVALSGRRVHDLDERGWRALRGSEVGMVFQDPMTALNPVQRIGRQLARAVRNHARLPRREVRRRCLAMLDAVGMPDPEQKLRAYPHELSGGQRQRVVIGTALLHQPDLIIADEPTASLDATIQAQILALLARRVACSNAALLLITHDLGMAAEVCDRIVVLYGGKVLEEGSSGRLLGRPSHPYTARLLEAIPRFGRSGRLVPVPGVPPHPRDLPGGCPFQPRCHRAIAECVDMPPLVGGHGHTVACWNPQPGDGGT